ncbi:MAG: fatty acid desaturase family protein [Bacteroidota bacterium]|jgi:linoleoyl-CoA desaturase|nr:acyl-CoA desaturase [Cytophagales bacterium]MCE2957210.1 acyl-CoA desaturase [Flammeovirgaceae bacterium]MCZ8070341.1 acyl-CoA desaturase [Cytophagales bacterium]
MEQERTITFAATHRDFAATLNKRVNDYFKSHNISRQGNAEMYIKTACMFAMYFTPYVLILTGVISQSWAIFAAVIVMGFGLAGIGLSVMHDANHGAYSDKAWLNELMGYSLNLVGANAFNWKIQHNVLHHSFTNVHDHDEDISPRGVLRLCPSTPWKHVHRYQFIYAWFLYGLMTIAWLGYKDFIRIVRYQRSGMATKQRADIVKEWFILIATKLGYVAYIFVAPLLFTAIPWYQVLFGVILMHYVAGFILAIIFQPAHVVEGTEFPVPDENNTLETNWAAHQLRTTSNFGNKSQWFTWYVGGLNFQIEHHLFPNICHVHYKNIAGIVRKTAQEFGLPYKTFSTFMDALNGHARHLKTLGKRPTLSFA